MQVASRLVELNLQIRSVFCGPLPSSGEQPENSDSEANISKPVRNSGVFAEPAAPQPRPRVAVEPAKEPVSPPAPPIEIAHQPVELQDLEEGVPDEEMEPDETPLGFSHMPSELFKQGLGTDNAMIFQDKLFQDCMLVQKVLLSGQSRFKLGRIVDLYHHIDTKVENKRRKIRPAQGQARTLARDVSCPYPSACI